MTLNLAITNMGMSCEEYTLLAAAGPCRTRLPEAVRRKMEAHEQACVYHTSRVFHESAVSTPVTPHLEKEAHELVEKLNN